MLIIYLPHRWDNFPDFDPNTAAPGLTDTHWFNLPDGADTNAFK